MGEDVLSLARHHPAWLLADALERRRLGQNNTLPPGNIRGAGDLRQLENGDFVFASIRSNDAFGDLKKGAVAFGSSALAFTGGAPARSDQQAASGGFVVGGSVLPGVDFAAPQQRQDVYLPQWEQAARARQEIAFARFLQTTGAQQLALRRARENDLGAALADDVEAARQTRFAPVDPLLPSDPTQLEMTNLRLRLLENARLTPLEKRRAQARLALLEARWRQNLQNGEQANRNEFLEQRDAQPLRVRNEGEARIVALMAQMRDEDAARRDATQAALRQRLQSDFNEQDATLGIVLPALSPSLSPLDPAFDGSASMRTAANHKTHRETDKTFAPIPSSNAQTSDAYIRPRLNFPTLPPFDNRTRPSTTPAFHSDPNDLDAQIRALRTRALRESAQWARLAAQSAKAR